MSHRPRLGLVAYEYPPLIGGMATYAQALARYLDERGWEVHVFANARAAADDRWFVHPLLTTDLARDLPNLRRFDMDLWHAINFGYAPLAFAKRPLVLTVHGTDFLKPWVRCTMDRVPGLWRAAGLMNHRWTRKALYTLALHRVDQVLTCSEFSARRFRREYSCAAPLKVVPNGVDQYFLDNADDLGRSVGRHPRRILTVCNLDTANRRKNVDGVIRAMALVGERLDLQYWIIGDGPERAALEALARRLNIEHRIRFLGRVDQQRLGEAYAACSLFVLVPRPQRNDVEGFGIVYLEAAALGTPSLAGRFGGAAAAVADGISGFFASDASPAAIAASLEHYFSGRIRFEGSVVREHARRHAWPTVLRTVEEIYERLLGRTNLTPSHRMERTFPHDKPGTALRPKIVPDWPNWIRTRPEARIGSGSGRVLLISYPFPPVGASPVQRPAKLARYLPDGGWSVEVLTAGHRRFDYFDETLLVDIPAGVRVHRIPGYEPACLADNIASLLKPFQGKGQLRHDDATWPIAWLTDRLYWRLVRFTDRLGWGNGEGAWVRPAAQAALNRHRQRPFDAVISTGPPHFVHRVARRIAARTGMPWVADLRDPLVSDFDRTPAHRRRLDTMRRLEREIMAYAARIVTTSPSLADHLRQRYPRRAKAIETITNGFDRDDLAALLDPEGRPPAKESPCTFVAMGSFYGRREIARLVEPLQRVLDRRPSWNGRVRLIIAGSIDAEQRRYWMNRMPEWLTFTGYLDHASALRLAATATCAVVVVPDCRHGRMSVPAKTYELLALPTHLLALVPPGSDTERIVSASAAVSMAPFEDADRVAGTMEAIIDAGMNGSLAGERDWAAIDLYDRGVIAARFAAVLDKACGGGGGEQTKLESRAAPDGRRLEVA